MDRSNVERAFVETFVVNISLITSELNFTSFVAIYRTKDDSVLWGGRGSLRDTFVGGDLPPRGFELGLYGPKNLSKTLKEHVDELEEFSSAAGGEFLLVFQQEKGIFWRGSCPNIFS